MGIANSAKFHEMQNKDYKSSTQKILSFFKAIPAKISSAFSGRYASFDQTKQMANKIKGTGGINQIGDKILEIDTGSVAITFMDKDEMAFYQRYFAGKGIDIGSYLHWEGQVPGIQIPLTPKNLAILDEMNFDKIKDQYDKHERRPKPDSDLERDYQLSLKNHYARTDVVDNELKDHLRNITAVKETWINRDTKEIVMPFIIGKTDKERNAYAAYLSKIGIEGVQVHADAVTIPDSKENRVKLMQVDTRRLFDDCDMNPETNTLFKPGSKSAQLLGNENSLQSMAEPEVNKATRPNM